MPPAGNAVQHARPGTSVTATLHTERRSGREWAIAAVTNEGPEIPPEVLPRLFTRFSRGPDSSGAGLGLYIAHTIATAHGGTLTGESLPGTGARFTLALPVRPA